MFKILYASNDSYASYLQLKRFIENVDRTKFSLKIAAYKRSSGNLNIDYMLDALKPTFGPNSMNLSNIDNLQYQVEKYSPNLIISDLEFFSAKIADNLKIPLWYCSSNLLYKAIKRSFTGLNKKFFYVFDKDPFFPTENKKISLNNAEKKLVYSHLGDLKIPPNLDFGFKWIRPYHKIGKISNLNNKIVSINTSNNKKLFSFLEKYQAVLFHDLNQEYKITNKDINDEEEYYSYLRNCQLFFCEGEESFLADAFYNGKFSCVVTNYNDLGSIISSLYSQHLGECRILFDPKENLDYCFSKTVNSNYNKINYLHEVLDEYIKGKI